MTTTFPTLRFSRAYNVFGNALCTRRCMDSCVGDSWIRFSSSSSPATLTSSGTSNLSQFVSVGLIAELRERSSSETARKLFNDFIREISASVQRIETLEQSDTHVSLHVDPHGVFCNHELQLGQCEVYGFDYDFTLAQYSDNLHSLIYSLAVQRMIRSFGYPQALASTTFDPSFAVRGLHFDTRRGLLLKIDLLNNIQLGGTVLFGRRPLSDTEVFELYNGVHVSREYGENVLRPLSDLFCLSEASLLANTVQLFLDENISFDPKYLYDDVKHAISDVHRSGLLHEHVLEDVPQYLNKNDELRTFLVRLLESGKKTFLLSNSRFEYVDGGMTYMIGENWRELFHFIMLDANKPNWFVSDRPFRELDTKSNGLRWMRINELHPGRVYVHGCLREFSSITKVKPHKILFLGDHLFHDSVEPQRAAGWKTCLVINELHRDIVVQNDLKYRLLLTNMIKLEKLMMDIQRISLPQDELTYCLHLILHERSRIRTYIKRHFNEHFGSMFRTHNKATLFAYNVQRYADVYTSRVQNFLRYSLSSHFFPEHRYLPHEMRPTDALHIDISEP